MSSVILHIGLHKTGTKYFQHQVFPFLDPKHVLYNPEKLDQLLLDFLKADDTDKSFIQTELHKEYNALRKDFPNKIILLSREAMAGNLFSAYKYWDHSVELLSRVFPDAQVIVSLRNQIDWLISCYRESLHEHHYQEIESFLCYNKNEKKFFTPKTSRNEAGYANLDSLSLNYHNMIKVLNKYFVPSSVHVLFFENLISSKEAEVEKISSLLGADINIPKQSSSIPNKGYSALSARLSLERARLLKANGFEKYLERPIFFYGRDSIPFGKQHLSKLCSEKYWPTSFKRNNEEVRSSNYPNLSMQEEYEYKRSWRYVCKNIIDEGQYIDWDLLTRDMRWELADHYNKLNRKLSELSNINDVPKIYMEMQ